MLIALNKPFGMLSQFTRELPQHRCLAELGFPPNVYAIGRLDADSEGLLLLSDEAHWNQRLLHPSQSHPRTYQAQVEHIPAEADLDRLRKGIVLPDFKTLPCQARLVDPQPPHPPRVPPIRERKTVPTAWIELTLTEGKNRQVRRMTAAIGFPTLRLIRVAMGGLTLVSTGLQPGEWRKLDENETRLVAVGSGR